MSDLPLTGTLLLFVLFISLNFCVGYFLYLFFIYFGTFADHTIDFVVCLGGDGALLHVNSIFGTRVPPVVAFFCGTLGFLTAFHIDEYQEVLNRVIAVRPFSFISTLPPPLSLSSLLSPHFPCSIELVSFLPFTTLLSLLSPLSLSLLVVTFFVDIGGLTAFHIDEALIAVSFLSLSPLLSPTTISFPLPYSLFHSFISHSL